MAASCPSDTDNWMLAAVGLKYLKDGLEEFADQNLKQQHQDYLNTLPSGSGQCLQCTIDDILPKHNKTSCKSKTCFCKDKQKRRLCPSGQCSQMHDLIVSSHRSGKPNWANTDLQQWYTNHVNIGTCFINTPGYKMKKSVSEIDCAGILSIIINNKFFDQALGGGSTAGSNDDFKKARDARNEILHEPNLQLLSGKLHYYICLFIKILTGSAINQTPAVQTALEKLTQIQNGQYKLSKAEEVAILKLKEKATAEIEATTSFALMKIGASGKECIKQTEKKIDTKTEQAIAAVQQMSQTSSQKIDTKTEQAVATVEQTSQTSSKRIDTKTREAVAAVERTSQTLYKRLDTKTEQAVAAVERTSQTLHKRLDTKTEQAVAVVERTSQTSSQRIYTKTEQAVAAVEQTSQTLYKRLDTKTEQAVTAIQQATQRNTHNIVLQKSKSEGFLSTLWQKKYLKRDLITYYRREFSTLSISPLFQKNEAPLLQFYRTPSLYQIQEMSPEQQGTSSLTYRLHRDQVGKSRTEIKSLEDIFFYGKRLNHCIYVTADAGYGKTSFSKKLLIDWCQAQNCIKSDVHFYKDSDVAIIKRFDYVFFVPLRNFREVFR